MKIDNPYNNILKYNTTSTGNPRMIVDINWPILGDNTYFMFWRGKKLGITGRNKAPDK